MWEFFQFLIKFKFPHQHLKEIFSFKPLHQDTALVDPFVISDIAHLKRDEWMKKYEAQELRNCQKEDVP